MLQSVATRFPACVTRYDLSSTTSHPALHGLVAAAALALSSGCGPAPIAYPPDTDIVAALRANFNEAPDNARARELVAQLGGKQGTLDYGIRRVVWRQGAFETHYDVQLRMGQAGADSLLALYAQMIPAEARQQLPDQALQAHAQWLRAHADQLAKTAPQQSERLRATLDSLDACYAKAAVGDTVPLMTGLGALLSPARDGWYAERLQTAGLQLRCLPL